MMIAGFGALAAVMPTPKAGAALVAPSGALVAVGGSGGGDPVSGAYPAEMLVDWVRVF